MKYGLSEGQLKEVVDILSSYPEIESAVLFGSRAMDTFKKGSDVDIAIEGQGVDYALALRVKGDLEETDLPFFFDVIAHSTIASEDLKRHIRQRGREIYRLPGSG